MGVAERRQGVIGGRATGERRSVQPVVSRSAAIEIAAEHGIEADDLIPADNAGQRRRAECGQRAVGRGQVAGIVVQFLAGDPQDADVAAEAANLTKAQTLQQASVAAMAQANAAPQALLALFRF